MLDFSYFSQWLSHHFGVPFSPDEALFLVFNPNSVLSDFEGLTELYPDQTLPLFDFLSLHFSQQPPAVQQQALEVVNRLLQDSQILKQSFFDQLTEHQHQSKALHSYLDNV